MRYRDKQWLYDQYVSNKLFINDIARMCSVSHACILKWLIRHGIERRGQARRSGRDNPHWKGGTYISSQGYRFVMAKGHHRAINGGYIPEQVLIAEKLLGRELIRDEVIHHIDGDRKNNDPSNLYLFTKKEHDDYHHYLRWGKRDRNLKSNLSMNG